MIGLAELVLAVTLALPPELLEPRAAPGERVTFVLPFPEERGGGEAHGSAASLEWVGEDFAQLTGDVVVRYRDMVLSAREVAIDLQTKEATASGNVVIDHGPSRLAGAVARFDLDTRTGVVHQATAAVEGDFFFSGDRVTKLGERTFEVENGSFTSCRGPVPAWSFQVGHAQVELEGYATVRDARMRVRTVPVFYLPWIVWPTHTERSAGLLVPKVGHSNTRGSYLGLAYYQVMGPSWDTTLYADLYSNQYYAVGNELRYHPREGTIGAFRGWAVQEPDAGDWRWKMEWDHVTTDLPMGLRGVLRVEDYSDFQFFRDYERQINYKARTSIDSHAFLTGNWGRHSMNFRVDRLQTFFDPQRSVELRRIPELQYKLRSTRIGRTPLRLALESSANYFSVDRSEAYRGEYGRLDLQPELKLPFSPVPWLSAAATLGSQLTWYGDSVDLSGAQAFTGESLTRVLPWAGLELVGPSFSRIFDHAAGGFARFKHVIEPRFDWGWVEEFEDQHRVPIFDRRDHSGAFHQGRVAVKNSLLAKPAADREGRPAGQAREILSLELARRYSFQDDVPLEGQLGGIAASQAGPLELILRSYPSERLGLTLNADYSLLFDQITSVRAIGNVHLGPNRVDFSWSPRWQDTTGELLVNQASVGWLWHLLPGRLAVSSGLSYDFQRQLLRDQRHFISYLGSCYTLRLELHESRTATQLRRDYLFSVDLKNVGTFLDLTGGQSEGF
jgi:LPS-assembly protein